MTTPVNKYLKIEPVKHEAFMASQKETFDEVGVVLAVADGVSVAQVGERVYFDSFMAKKYPDPDDDKKHLWFVLEDEIVAVDR